MVALRAYPYFYLTPLRSVGPTPTRVVFCLDNMQVGGTEMNAVRTAGLLKASGAEVTVACLSDEGPLTGRYEALGIEVIRFPMTSLHSPHAMRQGLRLSRFLLERKADVVHSHDMYSNLFAVPWGRFARRPVVISSCRWWHSLPDRKLRIGNRLAFRMSDCVLVNSPTLARAVSRIDGVAPARIRVVPNFADDQAFATPADERGRIIRSKYGIADDALVVGCVARLTPVKDHASLLHAASMLKERFPRLQIVLVGDGPIRTGLEQLAVSLGLSAHVRFLGTVLGTAEIQSAIDISVLCSRSEGFPNAIIEAMAAARPVVATAVGGIVDAVVDGQTGLLVSSGNPAQLADALARLLASPALRVQFGTAAREHARTHYGATQTLANLAAVYQEFVARRSA